MARCCCPFAHKSRSPALDRRRVDRSSRCSCFVPGPVNPFPPSRSSRLPACRRAEVPTTSIATCARRPAPGTLICLFARFASVVDRRRERVVAEIHERGRASERPALRQDLDVPDPVGRRDAGHLHLHRARRRARSCAGGEHRCRPAACTSGSRWGRTTAPWYTWPRTSPRLLETARRHRNVDHVLARVPKRLRRTRRIVRVARSPAR